MNSKMMAAGLALVLVAMAMPTNAYHVTASGSDATNPHNWTARVGASFPVGDPLTNGGDACNAIRNLYGLDPALNDLIDAICIDDAAWDAGDGIVGFTLCEVPASTSVAGPVPGRAGFGGLCFMSFGCGGGNSDGTYNAYDSGACKAAADPQTTIVNVARTWVEIQMLDENNTPVDFLNECGFTSDSFVYDEQYVYTMMGGHVSGFPVTATPGAYGTYSASAYGVDPATTHTACGGALPMYY